ncbi:MAG: coenzyme F420-0:L-glutamate ligase [Dehalococcoidia bacterium]|nr:coenzyme F420-0:L-glutamate ligase [Dehalococcoidia bacterium]
MQNNEPQRYSVTIFGITGIPEVQPGDRLGTLIASAASEQGSPLVQGDILVVTQKIISKAEGRLVNLSLIAPSDFAIEFARHTDRDPRLIELVLRESKSIVRMDPDRGVIISETHHGFVCANAGIDQSNVPGDDVVCLLPKDSDASARRIRDEIQESVGLSLPIIVSDTFGRAWREGHVNFAIGVAGMDPMTDYRGTRDAQGREMHVTTIAVADELAAAAELVQFKAVGVPVSVVRGYPFTPADPGYEPLIRERERDMFR